MAGVVISFGATTPAHSFWFIRQIDPLVRRRVPRASGVFHTIWQFARPNGVGHEHRMSHSKFIIAGYCFINKAPRHATESEKYLKYELKPDKYQKIVKQLLIHISPIIPCATRQLTSAKYDTSYGNISGNFKPSN